MKLEIKHLAPYLPYKMKGNYRVGDVIKELSSSQDVIRDKILDASNVDFFLTYCKPILRPLSDLTKEIEHNGERFVPIEYLWHLVIATDSDSVSRERFYKDVELGEVDFLPYKVIPYLFKWHFDVFGLIPEGLAIDINTLKTKQP